MDFLGRIQIIEHDFSFWLLVTPKIYLLLNVFCYVFDYDGYGFLYFGDFTFPSLLARSSIAVPPIHVRLSNIFLSSQARLFFDIKSNNNRTSIGQQTDINRIIIDATPLLRKCNTGTTPCHVCCKDTHFLV